MGKKIAETIKETPLIYKIGIFIILLLPLLNIPPLFAPPAFGKSIVFRIVFSALFLYFVYDIFFAKRAFLFREFIKKIKGRKEVFFFAPLALLAILLFSVILSVDTNFSIFGDPARGGGFLNFSLIIIFGYFSFFLLQKKEWKTAWNILFFTGVGATFLAFAQWQGLFEGLLVEATRRPYASFGNPTILGTYLAILIFPLISFLLKEERKTQKNIYIIFLAIIFFGVILTFTRAAVLGIVAGSIYFALFFPRKEKIFKYLKVGLLSFLAIAFLLVYYVNTSPLPDFVKENSFLHGLTRRMDVQRALEDPRIGGFVIGWNAILEKPVTGYGVENFAYAFDRHFHPEAPFIQQDGWWDTAHNLPIEIGVWGGFPALLIFLLIFISLFLALRKRKEGKEIDYYALQATLITFFVANFFTVDDFSTYLLFAVIIGYIFYLCIEEKDINIDKELNKRSKINSYKVAFMILAIPFFLWFSYSLNWNLLTSNRDILIAESYQSAGECEKALSYAKKATSDQLPIDAYLFFKKGLIADKCIENEEEKAQEMFNAMKVVTEKRPSYTRGWTNLGTSAANLVDHKEDPEKYLQKTINAYEKALNLRPNRYSSHRSLSILYAKKGNFKDSLDSSRKCLELKEDEEMCVLLKAISMSVLDKEGAKKAREEAREYNFTGGINTILRHHIETKDYEKTIPLYLLLIKEDPSIVQNYFSLATAYRETGYYEKAKEYALKGLEEQPGARYLVEEFLETLPK